MAVRKPIYLDSSNNFREMTTEEVLEWTKQICYLYGTDPSVTLSQVSSSGTLYSMDDTRMQAGAMITATSAFPNEATTAEPSIVTVTYDKISQANASVSPTADTGTTWPMYITSGNDLQAMSTTDIKDTFLHPAIDLLISGTESATTYGTYTITETATPVTNYSVVSATPIYIDTVCNTTLYAAADIGETLDQPQTTQEYFLHLRTTGTDNTPTRTPIFITDTLDVQTFSTITIKNLFKEWIRETASESTDGYKIAYQAATSGSGNTRGTAMVNTKLDGAGLYVTFEAYATDYRAQEFPNGSVQTIATYNLRINKE